MIKTKKFFILILFLIGIIFGLPQIGLAIGQMTKPIVFQDVLRGQELAATLNLFNSEDKEVVYQLKADGWISSWASFYNISDENLENPITEIKIPPKSRLDAFVKFQVPEDVPNGTYSGQILVISAPTGEIKTGEMTASVFESVGREVSITVTDQEIIKVKTTIIPEKYDIGAGEPLKIKIIYENQGNISVKPDYQLKITKDERVIFNAIFPYPETEEAIKPRERKTMPLFEWQTSGQSEGRYVVEVITLISGEVSEKNDFYFNIGNVAVLGEKSSNLTANKFLAAIAMIGGGNLIISWIVIGGIFLFLAAILKLVSSKRNRKRRKHSVRNSRTKQREVV